MASAGAKLAQGHDQFGASADANGADQPHVGRDERLPQQDGSLCAAGFVNEPLVRKSGVDHEAAHRSSRFALQLLRWRVLASPRQLSEACRHFDGCLGGFAGKRLAKNFAMLRFGQAVVTRRPHLLRRVVFQLAQVAVPRALFASILRRIDDLRPQPPPLPA